MLLLDGNCIPEKSQASHVTQICKKTTKLRSTPEADLPHSVDCYNVSHD